MAYSESKDLIQNMKAISKDVDTLIAGGGSGKVGSTILMEGAENYIEPSNRNSANSYLLVLERVSATE